MLADGSLRVIEGFVCTVLKRLQTRPPSSIKFFDALFMAVSTRNPKKKVAKADRLRPQAAAAGRPAGGPD
jgi:hypothetical protein